MTRLVPPLITAALDAWDEVESLRREARLALALQDSLIGLKQAADACDAYSRSYERAVQIQRLADQDADGYNVWEGVA